jgi:hypothetical protein
MLLKGAGMKVQIAKLGEPRYRSQPTSKETLLERFSGIQKNYSTRQRIQELFHVTNNLNGDYYHANYMEYLETAWANHYGVVMTPDIMWHTLLSEAVQIVAEDPKRYATLFTETPDQKQTIIIRTPELVVMPLDVLIYSIKKLVPTNTDAFMPEFTTTTDAARFARYASFADLVSPYYNYMMLACGIPYVDVRGTKDDWQKVSDCWQVIAGLLPGHEEYFASVQKVLRVIPLNLDNPTFWLDMFRLEKCGSGSQTEAFGWFTDLFRNQPQHVRYVENFATHLAKVCYKQIDTNKKYEMYHGIVNSRLEGDCLEPDFASFIYHRPENPVVEAYDPYARMQIETTVITAKK